jgi:YD repeat-containing protein
MVSSATQINQAAYAYNPVGNRTSLTDRRGAQAFGYDTLDRLTSASHPLLATPQAFAYDPVGNRTTGGSVVNAGNQLTADTNFAYQYDDNGNLTRKTLLATGNFTQYTYDAENRLTKVEDFAPGIRRRSPRAPIATMGWADGSKRSPMDKRSGTSMMARISSSNTTGPIRCKPAIPMARGLTSRLPSRKREAPSSIIRMG